jgi:hypothetical protein
MVRGRADGTNKKISGVMGGGESGFRLRHDFIRPAWYGNRLLIKLQAFSISGAGAMLGLKISYVLRILLVGISLLVLGKFVVEFLLCSVRLRLKRLLVVRTQFLPSFADQFCDIGEGEILSSDLFSDPV